MIWLPTRGLIMFKPQLAPNEDPLKRPTFFEELKFPLLCSPKLDGIRGYTTGAGIFSRTGKLLPSLQVQDEFSDLMHFDGEVIVGSATDHDVYNRTQSHVMSIAKEGDISYHVFDYIHPDWLNLSFYRRLEEAEKRVKLSLQCNLKYVPHTEVNNLLELLVYETTCLEEGYEGIMMRDPAGRYKRGRCTWNEGIIYKLKRFTDAEASIVGFREEMTNTNEKLQDEFGYAKRSSSKAGLIPANTLGKFVVDFNGQELDVGCGSFTHEQRKLIWDCSDDFLGDTLKFRFFGHGVKDLPRFSRALGFRTEDDI
jgi:DNA ligase-1